MTAPVELEALGVRFRIEPVGAEADSLAELLRAAWDRLAVADDGAEPDVVLRVGVGVDDDDELVTAGTRSETLELLTQHVTAHAITRWAGAAVMLHACALAHPVTGRTVVLVGPSGMGKTTLSRTLGATWGYVTDEAVVLDAEGALHAYPKPLSVITGPGAKEQLSATALGLGATPGRLSLAGLVLLDRAPDRAGVVVDTVPTVEALVHLAEHTSYLATLPRPLHRLADIVEAAGGLRRASYAEASELRAVVTDLIGAPA